jgi:gamma-glutamyl-gamma-aminobutyrate hydrolase PuuD
MTTPPPTQPVVVSPGSLLHRIAGATVPAVNSFHHQAADIIGAGLAA